VIYLQSIHFSLVHWDKAMHIYTKLFGKCQALAPSVCESMNCSYCSVGWGLQSQRFFRISGLDCGSKGGARRH